MYENQKKKNIYIVIFCIKIILNQYENIFKFEWYHCTVNWSLVECTVLKNTFFMENLLLPFLHTKVNIINNIFLFLLEST